VSRFSSVLADRMEAMLRFGTEQEQGDPGDPSESPSLPDVENAVPDDVQDSALQNIESLGPIFGAILNMVIGVVSGIVLTAIVALSVSIVLSTRSLMLRHVKFLLPPGVFPMGLPAARVGIDCCVGVLYISQLLVFIFRSGFYVEFAWCCLLVFSVR